MINHVLHGRSLVTVKKQARKQGCGHHLGVVDFAAVRRTVGVGSLAGSAQEIVEEAARRTAVDCNGPLRRPGSRSWSEQVEV